MNVQPATGFRGERMNIRREAPDVSKAMAELGREITLEPVVRELVKLRASILNGCAYCIDMHSKVAATTGLKPRRMSPNCADSRSRVDVEAVTDPGLTVRESSIH